MADVELDPSGNKITIIPYEEWKQLPGAFLPKAPDGKDRPTEWYRFGKDEAGKPRASMTKDGVNALLAAIEQEVGLPSGELPRVVSAPVTVN